MIWRQEDREVGERIYLRKGRCIKYLYFCVYVCAFVAYVSGTSTIMVSVPRLERR
jgi:hypothetical protein